MAKRTRPFFYRRSRLCRVLFLGHSANLCRVPSRTRQKKLKRDGRTAELANGTANWRTGRVENFAECHMLGTRQRFKLRRVPTCPHSAKFGFLSSVRRLALGEVWVFAEFAECQGNYTRQIRFPGNRKMVALPSVRVKTLGKTCCFFIFFLFLCINHIHHQKKHIYIPDKRYSIYMAHPSHNNANISRCVA